MIKSFKDKAAEELYSDEFSKKLPQAILQRAFRKLEILDSATSEQELRAIPGNHYEKLFGDRSGQSSIKINDQYRVCFIWKDGDAYEVEITDYH
jgi:proteic killer suppression protein